MGTDILCMSATPLLACDFASHCTVGIKMLLRNKARAAALTGPFPHLSVCLLSAFPTARAHSPLRGLFDSRSLAWHNGRKKHHRT